MLEETYPAGFYDIPVTGNWFLEEKENIIRSIRSFISKNQYQNTIFFLPEDMLFVKERLNLGEDFILWKKGTDNQFDELKARIGLSRRARQEKNCFKIVWFFIIFQHISVKPHYIWPLFLLHFLP